MTSIYISGQAGEMMGNIQNRKCLIACVFILGIVTLGVTAFLFVVRLETPIFLKSYLEYNYSGADPSNRHEFSLQYLSNTDDSRTVIGIEFPNIADDRIVFYATEFPDNVFNMDFLLSDQGSAQPSTAQKIGVYSLHTVWVTVQQLANIEDQATYTVLQNARVKFNDGSSQEVTIGEVRLLWNFTRDDLKFYQIRSESTNNGASEETWQSGDDFTVIGFNWSPAVKAEELFSVTLNGIDAASDELKGAEITNGSVVTIQTNFPPPHNLTEKFSTYKLLAFLTLKDSNGVEWKKPINYIYYRPAISSFWEILRYNSSQSEK